MAERSLDVAVLVTALLVTLLLLVIGALAALPPLTLLLMAGVGLLVALVGSRWAARRAPATALDAELSRRVRELDAINAVSQRANSTLDAHEVMRGILDEMVDAFPRARKGLVHLLDARGHTLIPFALSSVRGQLTKAMGMSIDRGIAGLAVRERQAVIIPDTSTDERFLDLGSNVRSLMVAPLIVGPRVLGALSLDSELPGVFTDDMAAVFQSLADRAAMALENARLYSESQQRVLELTQLYDSALALSGVLSTSPLMERLVEQAAELLICEGAALYQIEGERLVSPPISAAPPGAAHPMIPANAAEGEPLRLMDEGARPLIVAPLLQQGAVDSVLALYREPEAVPFEESELRLLTLFAQQAASLLENARLIEELHAKRVELEEANRALSRASQAKSEFLASMSHELRTPLNSILGFSEILIDQAFGPLNERQTKYLETINNSGRHLLDLINDILDLSKIEAGRMELAIEPFMLAEVLAEVEATVEPLAARKKLSLTFDATDAPSQLSADRLRFKQVLYNILSNAVKFTTDGGSVQLRAWGEGDTLHVAVSDSGVGIPAAKLEQIFDTFHQLDGAYSREAEGTGLGLALVRRFVELHGGTVQVESRLSEGSTFTVIFPQPTPETG